MRLLRAGRAALLAALVAAGAVLGCEQPPEAIHLQGNLLTVQNQTGLEWQDVEVWLNDHYRVTRSSLGAGQRLDVPLDAFVAGFGQRFNHRLQTPTGIEVSAKGDGGRDVKLVWGKGRRK